MPRYQVTHPGFYALSIFSLSILLVITGIFISGLFFSQEYARSFRENIKLIAEIESGTSTDIRDKIISKLESTEGVRPESVVFLSKEDILREVADEIGGSTLAEEMENPFLDIVEFSLKEDFLNPTYIDSLESTLKMEFPITSVHRPQSFYGDIFSLLKDLQLYIFAFIAVALVLTGILIHHIMRLNVVAQREQIRTMELVGARPAFIVRPYVIKGLQMGLFAWAIAVGLTIVLWFALLGKAGIAALIESPASITAALLLLLLALVTCASSSWIAVMKSIGRTYL